MLLQISSGPAKHSSFAQYIKKVAEKLSSYEKDPQAASQLYVSAKRKLCSLVVARLGTERQKPDISNLFDNHVFAKVIRSPNDADYVHGAITGAIALDRPEIAKAFMFHWEKNAYSENIFPPPLGLASISELSYITSKSTSAVSESIPKAPGSASAQFGSASKAHESTSRTSSSLFDELLEHPNTKRFLSTTPVHALSAWRYAVESGNMDAAAKIGGYEKGPLNWIRSGVLSEGPITESIVDSLIKGNSLEEIEAFIVVCEDANVYNSPVLSDLLSTGARFESIESVAGVVRYVCAGGFRSFEYRKMVYEEAGLYAARRGHARVLELLMDSIAKLPVGQRRQMFPVHPIIVAAERGFVGIPGVVLEPTATKKHPTEKEFYKAFGIAALEGHTEFLDVMLQHRAISKSRLDWVSWLMANAASKGHDCVVRLLQRRIFVEGHVR